MNRNQPCSCGSGKRYKHCHGAAASSALDPQAGAWSADVRLDPQTILRSALSEQEAGRFTSAETLYERALEALPGHFDATHMLGVVKLQVGKFEEAARLLAAGLPLAPSAAVAPCKHNLALSLVGLARRLGVLDTLTSEPRMLASPAPFVRADAIPATDAPESERISIVLTNVSSVSALRHSLDGVREQPQRNLEIVAATTNRAPVDPAIQQTLADCGIPARWIAVDGAEAAADRANAAAAAATGTYLCFLRAGDRWVPQWLQWMHRALNAYGAQWGYGGLRVIAENGAIARFGSSPDTDALLRAQDALYAHRTASLGFLSFNPIAAGRNLMMRRACWRQRGGFASDATDPFLEWGFLTSREDEPVYVDAPGYLIPTGTEHLHAHHAFARMGVPPRVDVARGHPEGVDRNPHFRHGLTRFWARQWRQIRASRASTMSTEHLFGCAAMLGVPLVHGASPDRG